MKIFVSLILFSLIGCASQKVSTTYKDVEQIKQDDFKAVKQIRYKKSDDYFSDVKSEYSKALNDESLERVYKYDGDVEIKGPLSTITEHCHRKEFQKAKELFKRYSKSHLKNPIYWNQVGTCFLLEGNRRKALLFYNKALSIKSNYAPALNNLGVMYVNEKDYSRALVAFRRARKSSDFNKTPRFNLANLYLHFGLYDRAITHANVLYQGSSTDVDVLNMLGTAHLMSAEPKTAIKFFKKIDSDFLEKAKFGINYSLALYLAGDKEKSLNQFGDVDKKMHSQWKNYYQEIGKYIGAIK
ncbi:MAG: tetratricopeptide (TPR) repeat protein [Bacteriovoracaceae bacterium]|jgi:tetratricopeptide (TPR) repeat protein